MTLNHYGNAAFFCSNTTWKQHRWCVRDGGENSFCSSQRFTLSASLVDRRTWRTVALSDWVKLFCALRVSWRSPETQLPIERYIVMKSLVGVFFFFRHNKSTWLRYTTVLLNTRSRGIKCTFCETHNCPALHIFCYDCVNVSRTLSRLDFYDVELFMKIWQKIKNWNCKDGVGYSEGFGPEVRGLRRSYLNKELQSEHWGTSHNGPKLCVAQWTTTPQRVSRVFSFSARKIQPKSAEQPCHRLGHPVVVPSLMHPSIFIFLCLSVCLSVCLSSFFLSFVCLFIRLSYIFYHTSLNEFQSIDFLTVKRCWGHCSSQWG